MDKETSRNTIIFFVCALGLLIAYNYFVLQPTQKREAALKSQQAAVQLAAGPAAASAPVFTPVPVDQALQRPSVAIDTPALTGSIALEGARFDDLSLKGYHETLDEKSPLVRLWRPQTAAYAYFTQFGWTGKNIEGMPDERTVWTPADTAPLSPTHPIRLTYSSPAGLVFTRDISVDDKFMFTVNDKVANYGTAPVTLAPFANVRRNGLEPPQKGARPSAEGGISLLGGGQTYKRTIYRYQKWTKEGNYQGTSSGGWIGVDDKYWLTALIPDQREAIQAVFTATPFGSVSSYDARYQGVERSLAPGMQVSEVHRMFGGAKHNGILTRYAKAGAQEIPRFGDAINWGWDWAYFITKSIFWLIKSFESLTHNFGLAILMMTVVVKAAFFYPNYLSIASMTKMKKVQPRLEKLKERFKDNPAEQQKAMMQIYKEEKINPLLGCLPMLATIPVFFGLFYVLNTTIEMRQAPFFGWIHDLSAPDPTSIWNLFGLIPWNPSAVKLPLIGSPFDGFLHLGVWPLLYGFTMWLTQSMSPPAADPTQQMIFKWMPVIFTLMLATFPAGLLIYYCWSNFLQIIMQYVINHRLKVDNPIDRLIRRITGQPAPAG